MASKSRAAQEKLAALEKDSAPFEDQLFEAAKFIGIDLDHVGRSLTQSLDLEEEPRAAIYHGREEWLLRWLLKKLQAPKDDIPRKTPNSWIIFCHLIRILSLPNAARMLIERKFIGILRQTLEEAQKAASSASTVKDTTDDSVQNEDKPLKVSKKRKRSGELVTSVIGSDNHGIQLPTTIFAAIYHMVRFTKATSDISAGGRTAEFSAEYMKSVIRTPAEDAAKILGSWLSLCRTYFRTIQSSDMANMKSWLSPFIEIWDSRTVGNEDLGQFSLFCSQPLLSLLKTVQAGDAVVHWKDELEQLVARNIMIPAKADRTDNPDSQLLNTLTRISVIQDSANAPILFEVAIRSVQASGPQRRRANDGWLQPVFATLRGAMPPQRAQGNGKAIQDMLQSAIKYKIDLGLPTLRSVTWECCMLEGSTNWDLLGTVVKLDANVFLIPDEKDLLQQLLNRITSACVEPTWAELSNKTISDVLVPLMNGFAKARDLSSFIRHWYAQLVEFERLRKEARLFSMAVFSAWEDEAFQAEFSKIMEASLTVTQITQLLDWLSTQVTEAPDAVCVILQAVAGSITQVEFSDAVGLRPYDIMFSNAASEKLDGRYKWRSWRILSGTLNWKVPTNTDLEEISDLWEEHALPFDSLSSKFVKGSLLDVVDSNTVGLETIEAVRFTCAAWDASTKNSRLRSLCKKGALDILQSLAQDIKLLLPDLSSDQEIGEETCGSTLNTLFRGIGWMLWSSVHCVFFEYPEMLQLGFELKGDLFKDLLQTIFWIASVPPNDPSSTDLNPWLRINRDAFPGLWTSMLNNEEVLKNETLISLIIDMMLCSKTNKNNPLLKSPKQNTFAVKCLLDMPLEVFLRKYRESVMRSWPPNTDKSASVNLSQSVELDPGVLGLKVKMMQRPTVYEGMKYQDLVNLAQSLASAKTEELDISFALFKELVTRTMSHITANLDQARNREYALDALSHLRKKIKPKTDKKKTHKLNFALTAMFEVLVGAFAAKERQLNDLDIILSDDLASLKNNLKTCLLAQLEDVLAKTKKPSKADKQAERSLTILSIIDALAKQEVDGSELANLVDAAKSFTASLGQADIDVGKRLDTFMATHSVSAELKVTDSEFGGDPSTIYGRQAIKERVQAIVTEKDQYQKLDLLNSILQDGAGGLLRLGSVLAVRYIIMACEDSRPRSDEDNEDDSFDLSTVYSILCSHLWKSTTIRQFSLISETMAMMLRTKNRAMNQWNIDSTLGSITIMCSRNAPRLRRTRAGTIYMHLYKILQTLLTSHRLKLQGHFHLVVQAMQGLLRCLFTPLPHSTSKTSKLFPPPPWLTSPKHQLNATHAAAFTRLVTLICDPSVSSVTRSKQNNLTPATDKAKRIAGQHMQFLLMLYIQLQLEMKMLPEVREKMVPGLYAIFDTTTPELRRMIGDSLDSSGRSVFGTLFRDYQRFGKWKGS